MVVPDVVTTGGGEVLVVGGVTSVVLFRTSVVVITVVTDSNSVTLVLTVRVSDGVGGCGGGSVNVVVGGGVVDGGVG